MARFDSHLLRWTIHRVRSRGTSVSDRCAGRVGELERCGPGDALGRGRVCTWRSRVDPVVPVRPADIP